MNTLIGIIILLFHGLLLLAGLVIITVIYNLLSSLFGKIFRTDLNVKLVNTAVYSENRINKEQVSLQLLIIKEDRFKEIIRYLS